MRVLLTSAYPGSAPLDYLKRAANGDCCRRRRIVADAEQADAILFVESSHYLDDPSYFAVRRHPLTQRFPEKVFIYNEQDLPCDPLPGLYVSMPARWFDDRWHASSSYLRVMNTEIAAEAHLRDGEPDLLYSFVGSARSRLRRRMVQIRDDRSVIEDTSRFDFFNSHGAAIAAARRRYAVVTYRSKFILCPRGAGTSSLRMYEAMEAGRTPVVLSDQWVAPRGPEWASAVVRVPERDVRRLPDLLRELEQDWRSYAEAAYRIWSDWFSPAIVFHRTISAVEKLLESRRAAACPMARRLSGMQAELIARGILRPVRDALRSALRP